MDFKLITGTTKLMWLILSTALKMHKASYSSVIALSLVSMYANVAGPQKLKAIIDMEDMSTQPLLRLTGEFAIIIGASSLARFISLRIVYALARQNQKYWREKALVKIYSLPMQWHDKQSAGAIANSVDVGSRAVWSLLNSCYGQEFLNSIPVLVAVFINGLRTFPDFMMIFLLPVPCYLIVNLWLSNALAKKASMLGSLRVALSRYLTDSFVNIKIVKYFASEKTEASNYSANFDEYSQKEFDVEILNFSRVLLQSVVDIIARIALLVLAAYKIQQKQLTIGSIAMLLSYQQMITGPLNIINGSVISSFQFLRLFKEILDIIDIPNQRSQGTKKMPPLTEELKFKDVSLQYENGHTALKNINFTIKANKSVAIFGKSGAGKSTLISLIMNQYEPTSGEITWNNEPVSNFESASLLQQIAIVPQDSCLFQRSIIDNIKYSDPAASMNRVIQAAKLAGAHEFIMRLPSQYLTVIGDSGTQLSGGQKQRIAIARAILKNPSILIFDESTNSLDSENEAAVQSSLANLRQSVTLIIISHHISTIQNVDEVVFLEDGRISAIGTIPQLLKKCASFKALYELQKQKN